MTASELREKLEANRYKGAFMTEAEFKKKLQDNGYTGKSLEIALQIYQKAKQKGYDLTAYYDELFGKINNTFSD